MQLRQMLLGVVLVAVLLGPATARADVTAADAEKLQTQLDGWFVSVIGPDPKLGTRLFDVVAEGDHFVVSDHPDPVDQGSPQHNHAAGHVRAIVKPLDATRWALVAVFLPVKDGPDGTAAGPSLLNASGVLDPTLATPSSFDVTFHIPAELMNDTAAAQQTKFGRAALHLVWSAATEGRVGLRWDVAVDDMTVSKTSSDGKPDLATLGRLALHTRIDGLEFTEAGKILRALATLGKAHGATPSPPSPRPAGVPPVDEADRPAAHALLSAMRNVSTGFEQTMVMTNLHFDNAGASGNLAKLEISTGASVQVGDLALRMSVALDGFDSPEVPPGILHDYLSHRFAFAPSLTGIPAQTVFDLIDHWIDHGDPGGVEFAKVAGDVLAKGPVTLGVSGVTLDIGPGHLTASGAVVAVSTATGYAEATVRLTGADAMLDDANTHPELKPAAPVLIFLKGLARQDGEALVWDIGYKDKKLLVNGTDVSAMVPK